MLDATLTRNTDLALSDEQQDFVRALRDFASKEVTNELRESVERDHHSDEIAKKLAELGWWSLCIDEEYGGSGGTFFDATLFLEEVARGQIPVAAYGVTLIVVGALNKFGSDEQKQEHLGHVARGGVLAIAMSEPDSGSDVASLKCRARLEDGEWVLNGAKMWCSYAHRASHTLIVCRTEEGSERHEGLSMILVPHDAEGYTITPIQTMGGEETNELHFDNVRVPESALLGTAGNGWTQLMAGLNNERVILAASALGLAQRSFDEYGQSKRFERIGCGTSTSMPPTASISAWKSCMSTTTTWFTWSSCPKSAFAVWIASFGPPSCIAALIFCSP